MTTDNSARLEALGRERLNAGPVPAGVRRRQADDQGGEVNDTANTCSECGAPAQFQHPEGDVDIHACARHRCDLCWATDDAEQSEHWDGIVPLGGDSLDGR